MSTRLEIVFEEAELEEIREAARRERLTVADWVRRVLRAARSRKPRLGVEDKLAALERAVQHDFPTGDVVGVLAQTEAGYRSHRSPSGSGSSPGQSRNSSKKESTTT